MRRLASVIVYHGPRLLIDGQYRDRGVLQSTMEGL